MLADGIEVKTIPGFPNYAITRDGRVWSKPRKDTINRKIEGRWLKSVMDGGFCNYYQVNLWQDGIPKVQRVHRLVLETYVGPCPEGMECRHLNGNPQDNRVENLAWGTSAENGQDIIRHGTVMRGEQQWLSKLAEQDVRMIIYMYRTGLFTQKEIASQYRISKTTVGNIIRKKTWKHLWAA